MKKYLVVWQFEELRAVELDEQLMAIESSYVKGSVPTTITYIQLENFILFSAKFLNFEILYFHKELIQEGKSLYIVIDRYSSWAESIK